MPEVHPRKTSLRDAVLIVCCQGNPAYRKLLADPGDPSPRWYSSTHSLAGRLAILGSRIPGLKSIILEAWQRKVPGGLLHFLARKRFVEDQVRDAIQAGFKQIVLFGSGYDSLGPRLAHEFPHLNVFEVDHPPTQAIKALGSRPSFPNSSPPIVV